ncbi:MAG: asparagine synthase (glutamine-hydrolyzing) [Verrucomicrobiae bacterium]|nr:asparagine synthase (glutamine-hydrolyzing) [Verrucomicrobiae bacterium]
MCAICGTIDFDGRPIDRGQLVAMRDVMANRGPDHAGEWFGEGAALGHRRLKVIDLSVQGNQPMPNEDETVWVVLNGEIYNFPELRRTLARRGHRFRSTSDTEVIVHGYEEWGEDVIKRLDGMYAIGIWDTKQRKLMLGVDRYGKKPLYVLRKGGRVHFASESKALMGLPEFSGAINPKAIECYLHYLATTVKHSVFEGVERIRPGHYRVYDAKGERVEKYWEPNFTEKQRFKRADALDAIDEQLQKAVRKRLISDVPLGAFLSGGVDSSMVVAMMAGMTDKPVRTFSVGFKEQDFSELEYARMVADQYGTDHHQVILEPDVRSELPSMVWEYGEPFADSSALPVFFVSKAAKDYVTVALTGDGGDEAFGGYDLFRASYFSRALAKAMPAGIRKRLEDRFLDGGNLREKGRLGSKIGTLLTHGSSDPSKRHGYWLGFTPADREQLYTPEFKEQLGGYEAWQFYDEYYPKILDLDLIDQNLFLTIVGRLPNDYLVKVDAAAMKVALELRSPFLDVDLGELSSRIHPLLKVRRGKQKYLLKKLAERYIPQKVIYRPKKGFSLPLKHWLRKDFAPVLEELLPGGSLVREKWFRPQAIRSYIDEHVSGRADHTHRIWALLWLEIWHRIFIDKSMSPTDSLR